MQNLKSFSEFQTELTNHEFRVEDMVVENHTLKPHIGGSDVLYSAEDRKHQLTVCYMASRKWGYHAAGMFSDGDTLEEAMSALGNKYDAFITGLTDCSVMCS